MGGYNIDNDELKIVLFFDLQVPLFQHMDNLVLENICDRVKSLIFTKGETVSLNLVSAI